METAINLEFRGEGNRAIVFANPQTNHVYRLVKHNATRKIRNLLQSGSSSQVDKDLKNIQEAVKAELDLAVSYMTNIMRPLLSDRYVITPRITSIPIGFGANALELAGGARPAHRKNSQFDHVDTDIQFALVMPDCCFVHHQHTADSPSSDSNSDSMEADDSFGSTGPSEWEILPRDSSNRINRSDSFGSCSSQESTSDPDENVDKENTESGLCSPVDLGLDSEELDQSESLILDSSNSEGNCANVCYNHCIYDNQKKPLVKESELFQSGNSSDQSFTLSIELKPKKGFLNKNSSGASENVCKFCMHQHLKRKSGKWPQTSSYCPLDLFSGNKLRMKHALLSLIKTPQNNLKICKDGQEIYGSDIRMDLNSILLNWFPPKSSRRQKLTSMFLDLVIEILLNTVKLNSWDESITTKLTPQHRDVQVCENSSCIHDRDDSAHALPPGCVLEQIYSIQCLDDQDVEGVYPLYTRLKARLEHQPHLSNKWCLDGPYNDISWLFGFKGERLEDLDQDSDDYAALKVKRFLVSKTLQDCSIIVAIKPVNNSSKLSRSDLVRFDGDLFEFSIKVIDLDPKPFAKVKTYYRQHTDISKTFAETLKPSQ